MASAHTPLLAAPVPPGGGARPNPDTLAFAVAMVALQAQWAVVYIYLVPQLLELHVPPSLASDAWLLSPLLQLVLSPLAGRLSDRLSGTHGRRRPFLVATTAISTVLLLCVPFLPHLCARGPRWVTVVALLTTNVLLDASNSINEEFQRALATDVTHHGHCRGRRDGGASHRVEDAGGGAPNSAALRKAGRHQVLRSPLQGARGALGSGSSSSNSGSSSDGSEGSPRSRGAATAADDDEGAAEDVGATGLHSAIAAACGVGSGLGYLLGGVDFASAFRWASALGPPTAQGLSANGDQVVLSLASALLFILGTAFLLGRVSEPPPPPRGDDAAPGPGAESASHGGHGLRGAWRVFTEGSRAFTALCAQQMLAWIGLWPVWVLGTAFFGHDVAGGRADAAAGTASAERYARGVRLGSVANGAMALVCVAASLAVPSLSARFGPRRVYVALQTVSGLAMVSLVAGVRVPWAAVALTGAAGLAWAANNSIPFALLAADGAMRGRMGLATTVLYLSQTVPQVFVSLTFGPLIELLGDRFVASPVAAGALLLLSAAVMRIVPAPAPPGSPVVRPPAR